MAKMRAERFHWVFLCVALGANTTVYRYASAETSQSQMLSFGCAGCHGTDGVSRGPASPSIAGFDMRYLFRVMRQFKQGERAATVMDRLAAGYTVKELRLIATHFSEQPWGNADAVIDGERAIAGSKLHEELCEECHEKGGEDQDHEVPRLAGQWPAYLYMQLLDYRDRPDEMPQPDKMRNHLEGLSDFELDALCQFYGEKR